MRPETDYSNIESDEYNYFLSKFVFLKPFLEPLFNYKQGNCHNLAHYASMLLQKHGIKHQKIWIFAPSRYQKHSRITINLEDPNLISSSGILTWGYHVALWIEYQHKTMVFDYFLDPNKPLVKEEWLEYFGNIDYKVEIHTAENYLFYGEEQENNRYYSLYKGEFFRYEGECKTQQWIEQGLAINETAHYFMQNERQNLDIFNGLSKDYKKLVGDIENFECVFRDFSTNKRMSQSFQRKHRQIIEQYREVYTEKLEKWQIRLNAILNPC
jgi:hypothetical protein